MLATELLNHFAESPPTVALMFEDGEVYESPLTVGDIVRHPLDALPPAPLPGLVAVLVVATGNAVIEDEPDPVRVRITTCITRAEHLTQILVGTREVMMLTESPEGEIPDAMRLCLGIEAVAA